MVSPVSLRVPVGHSANGRNNRTDLGKITYSAIDAIRPDCAYMVAPVEEPYPLNEKLSVVRLEDLDGLYKFTERKYANSPNEIASIHRMKLRQFTEWH